MSKIASGKYHRTKFTKYFPFKTSNPLGLCSTPTIGADTKPHNQKLCKNMVLLFIFSLICIEHLFANILCYLPLAYILSNISICNYLEFEDILTLNVYNKNIICTWSHFLLYEYSVTYFISMKIRIKISWTRGCLAERCKSWLWWFVEDNNKHRNVIGSQAIL